MRSDNNPDDRGAAPGAPDEGFDAEAVLAGAAAMLGLTITAEQRPGVLMHLANTRRVAGFVVDVPLPEDVENGPVFRP